MRALDAALRQEGKTPRRKRPFVIGNIGRVRLAGDRHPASFRIRSQSVPSSLWLLRAIGSLLIVVLMRLLIFPILLTPGVLVGLMAGLIVMVLVIPRVVTITVFVRIGGGGRELRDDGHRDESKGVNCFHVLPHLPRERA